MSTLARETSKVIMKLQDQQRQRLSEKMRLISRLRSFGASPAAADKKEAKELRERIEILQQQMKDFEQGAQTTAALKEAKSAAPKLFNNFDQLSAVLGEYLNISSKPTEAFVQKKQVIEKMWKALLTQDPDEFSDDFFVLQILGVPELLKKIQSCEENDDDFLRCVDRHMKKIRDIDSHLTGILEIIKKARNRSRRRSEEGRVLVDRLIEQREELINNIKELMNYKNVAPKKLKELKENALTVITNLESSIAEMRLKEQTGEYFSSEFTITKKEIWKKAALKFLKKHDSARKPGDPIPKLTKMLEMLKNAIAQLKVNIEVETPNFFSVLNDYTGGRRKRSRKKKRTRRRKTRRRKKRRHKKTVRRRKRKRTRHRKKY